MDEIHRSLEDSRLEIVLLGAGVLVLVSVFAIVILTSVDLKTLRQSTDAEMCRNTAAWGGTWEHEELSAPPERYWDESMVDAVRRHSISLAEEIKNGLRNLKSKITATRSPVEREQDNKGMLESLRSYSMSGQKYRSQPDLECEEGVCNVHDQPGSTTGRDVEDVESRRRSSRIAGFAGSSNVET